MEILILGAGQVGTTLAQNLSIDHNVTMIDIDDGPLSELKNKLDIQTIQGSASDPAVLEEARAQDMEMLIAVTSSNECNMIACQIAYSLFKTPTKICRIKGNHLDDYPQLLEPGNLAIDTVINPAELVTQSLVRQIHHPGTQSVLDFSDGIAQVASIRIDPEHDLCGRKISELSHDLADYHATVVGIVRNDQALLPDGNLVLKGHDELYFCSIAKDLNPVVQTLLQQEQKLRRIMIAGGGNVGITLAQKLEKDYSVKVIERYQKQSEIAAGALQDAFVLMGDAADAELLQNENIDNVDLFCAITNDDENNIMSSIIAKRLGARMTIALVNRQTYAHFLIERSPDIDIALSPQRITGGKILTFLRKGDIVNVYPINQGKAEFIEVVAHGSAEASKIIGKSILEIKLPHDCKICGIVRNNEFLLPKSTVTIQKHDHLIVFVSNAKTMPMVEKLFQVSPSFAE